MIPYEKLLADRGIEPKGRLLAIDPGMTTGWSVFDDGKFVKGGQLQTNPDIGLRHLLKFVSDIDPTEVVMERYTIYEHKLRQHSGSDVPTLRLIGALEFIFDIKGIPVTLQGANQAKGFCNDDKLKAWGLWKENSRHYHDSVRHALYYLLFSASAL